MPEGPVLPRSPRVLVDGLEASALHRVREVARLLGAEVAEGPGAGAADLVLVGELTDLGTSGDGGGVNELSGAPVIVVGPGAAMRLPGDEEVLAEAISSVATPRIEASGLPSRTRAVRSLTLAVAGWEGGVGTTTLARGLAGAGDAVLVDVSGAGAGVLGGEETPGEGVFWADLDPRETRFAADLVGVLPRADGIPVLSADGRGGATASDPRLPRVVEGIAGSGNVVVDLGRWNDRAGTALVGGAIDVVCLVGRGNRDSAVALSASVALCPPTRPVVVVHTGRADSLLDLAVGTVGEGVPVWRFRHRRRGPRPRDMQRLWEVARREEAHRWMSGWAGARA